MVTEGRPHAVVTWISGQRLCLGPVNHGVQQGGVGWECGFVGLGSILTSADPGMACSDFLKPLPLGVYY